MILRKLLTAIGTVVVTGLIWKFCEGLFLILGLITLVILVVVLMQRL